MAGALGACMVGSAGARAAPVELRVGTIAPEGSAYATCAGAMRDAMHRAAGPGLRIKLFLGAALGDEQTMLGKTLEGKHQQATGVTMATVATAVPELALFDLPFLFENEAEVDAVLASDVRERVRAILARHDLELIGLLDAGWRHLASRRRPIATPGDLAGLRVRSQPLGLHLEMWRALGALPKPLPITELMTALEVGHIEAFDIPAVFLFGASLHTQIRYFARSAHVFQVGAVVASRKTVSPAHLRLLASAWQRNERACNTSIRDEAWQVEGELTRAGITVTVLSPQARAAFKEKLAPLRDSFRKATTPAGRALLAAVERVLARQRRER